MDSITGVNINMSVTCQECGKHYTYHKSYGKHMDKAHPEIVDTPFDLLPLLRWGVIDALIDEADAIKIYKT